MSRHLFAYGRFLGGEEMEEFLSKDRRVRPLGPARIRGSLYTLDGMAGWVPEGTAWVAGELYRCDEIERLLDRLDRLHEPSRYRRELRPVRWKHGEVEAWIYAYAGPLEEAEPLPGGSFKARRRGGRAGGEGRPRRGSS